MLNDDQEIRFIADLLQKREYDELSNGDERVQEPQVSQLSVCSGYWGTYQFAGTAEYTSGGPSGYLYYWSPNGYFPAPGNDCGTDHNDYMVSFWMGPDYSMNEGSYRSDGTNWYTDFTLWAHGGGDYRLHTSNAYGPWYGNAYVCLSIAADPSTLRFGRVN